MKKELCVKLVIYNNKDNLNLQGLYVLFSRFFGTGAPKTRSAVRSYLVLYNTATARYLCFTCIDYTYICISC